MKNNKIIYLFFLVFFFFFLHFIVSANDTWRQLNNFTKKEYDLIFKSQLSNMNNEYSDIFNISKKINLFENLKWNAIDNRKKAERRIDSVISRITNLENTLKIITENIAKTEKMIEDVNKDISNTKKKININTKIIENLKAKIDRNKKTLAKYLEYLYKKKNTAFYDSWEMDNMKSVLLNNENISDLLNDLYFNSVIQLAWEKLISQNKKYVLELYIKKVNLEKQKVRLNMIIKQQIIARKNLSDKRKFKETLLEASRWKQKEYEKFLDKKIDVENNIRKMAVQEKIKFNSLKDKILEKYGCEFLDVSKNTSEVRSMKANFPKCYNINKMIYSESRLSEEVKMDTNSDKKTFTMPWPIDPYKWISAYFHDVEYKKSLWAEHNAIDIRASQWTAIKAPMDWYVIYMNKPDSQEYSFVAIKHFDSYVTVYWHLSKVLVNEYDYIKKWQIFAETGWEYGTKWAWFITSWPHLHFEVFKNQEFIDPLMVLDLSYLKYKDLPKKSYKMKYLFDFRNRRWYEYSEVFDNNLVFNLKWADEISRQKYLLSYYAAPWFRNWKTWVNEWVNWNIDPSLLMCIWVAESSLWRNLTTKNNIWNVWNNDRWDRRWFDSPRDWIAAIAYTLNNKYLWNINRLDALSWAWRLDAWLPPCDKAWQFCYASDLKYWHSNVLSCLSHLKWYVVTDDYNFRFVNY